ncbi:MAG: 50S ribosomal protein L25 [Candidatus Omnitrophota bacterium]
MEQVKLEAQLREMHGKGDVKKIRVEGLCPCVLYKGGKDSVSLAVAYKKLTDALKTSAGENVIVSLNIKGDAVSGKQEKKSPAERTAIIKEIQRDPIKGNILHVDFHEISLTEVIQVMVSITTKGESPGIKEGGILQYMLREVEVECLPTKIPKDIEIDISQMNIGDTKLVKDLHLSEGVKILNDAEIIVIGIEPPMKEEVITPAAPEEAPAEPEVIREKKLTPDEAAAAAAEEEKGKEKGKEKEKEKK